MKWDYCLEMWVLNNGYLYSLRLLRITPWPYKDPYKPAFGYKCTIAIQQFVRLYGKKWETPINKAKELQEKFSAGDWHSVNEYHNLISAIANGVEIIYPIKI